MNPNEPESNAQIPLVEFSPSQSTDAVGVVGPPPPRPPMQFSVFFPIAIVLLTLNFSAVRDIIALNRRMTKINDENAPALEMLKKSSKQTDFAQALRDGVLKLAPTDPVAAHIAKDFFPPAKTTTPAPKPGDAPDASKTPAK